MKDTLLPRNCFQFPLVKVIVSKIAYIKFENTKNEHFFTTSHRKVARENFSGTSDGSYWSKSWRDWSGLSIAPTPERIRRVEATNDVNEEKSNSMSRKLPLKKNAQVLTKIFHIDQKLNFDVLHILNRVRISKIEKNIGRYRSPPPKKRPFFGGGGLEP